MESSETWKDVPGTEGRYKVSSLGRIESLDAVIDRKNHTGTHKFRIKGRVIKPTLGHNGYYYVSIVRNGVKKKEYVHRLVATTFYGPSSNLEVNHKNGDRTDNRASNLEWTTGKENMQHCVYALGHLGRLTAPMRRVKCVDTGVIYPSISAAARAQGIKPSMLRMACINKTKLNGLAWIFIDAPGEPSEIIEQSKKKVECMETGKVYNSVTEAAEDVERCISAVSMAAKSDTKTCAGYHWRYA